MNLTSLGLLTDLIFVKFDGEVIDRGNYLVARTRSNPNFFWGNLLIFDRPPQKGDLDRWRSLFASEFTDPRIYHQTFTWDSPETGEVSQFTDQGFKLERTVVLATDQVQLPPKYHSSVVVRPLETQQEWERSVRIQVESADDHLTRSQWESFYQSAMARYQSMVGAEKGLWFGAFVDGEMAASLGIFTEGTIGRYQIVSTHPEFQRRGICGSLVYHSARYALEKMQVQKLVMIADEEYHAARIYESVGFKPVERMVGVCWWDRARA